MDTLDLVGKPCPVPVIETKRHLDAAAPGASVEVWVDDPTSVDNLEKFARQQRHAFERLAPDAPRHPGGRPTLRVRLTKADATPPAEAQGAAEATATAGVRPVKVVAIGSATMGEGDERLGQTLLAGFLYALTEATPWPDAILFYNGGARWTTADSVALDDLRRLEAGGVQILTCGLCLNHYGLTDALAVGGVTNMYAIAQTLMSADTVIKP